MVYVVGLRLYNHLARPPLVVNIPADADMPRISVGHWVLFDTVSFKAAATREEDKSQLCQAADNLTRSSWYQTNLSIPREGPLSVTVDAWSLRDVVVKHGDRTL